jgi:type I restriction enzyme S subunit
MIADLKPYAAYRDSGSSWLAQVPTHWEVRALRTLIRPRNERNRIDLPLLSVAREKGVFVRSMTDANENHNVIPLDLTNYKVARAGALVINKMKAWQGSMGIAPCDGIVSPAYYVYDFDIANGKFGQSLLRSKPYVAHFGQASDGVRVGQWDLTVAAMRQIPVLVPPPEEQAAIVRFLDWANARLERTIRAKRRVIALLTEQKQAIIHRAVTRGLDPAAPLKPSGIAWLGDIPAHWGTLRSKHLFSARKDFALPDDVQLSATQSYGVIPQSEYEDKVGRRVVKIFMHLEKRRHVERDDFVISMRSFQGGLERAWASGAIRSSYVVLKPSSGVNVEFFAYLFKSQGYIGALQSTAEFIRDGQDLNYGNFCRVDLPLIPLEEQRAIAKYIARATIGLDKENVRLTHEIDLLREYRTRLVADVVTGKLDVRAAAAALPQDELPSTTEAGALNADDDLDTLDESEPNDEETAA